MMIRSMEDAKRMEADATKGPVAATAPPPPPPPPPAEKIGIFRLVVSGPDNREGNSRIVLSFPTRAERQSFYERMKAQEYIAAMFAAHEETMAVDNAAEWRMIAGHEEKFVAAGLTAADALKNIVAATRGWIKPEGMYGISFTPFSTVLFITESVGWTVLNKSLHRALSSPVGDRFRHLCEYNYLGEPLGVMRNILNVRVTGALPPSMFTNPRIHTPAVEEEIVAEFVNHINCALAGMKAIRNLATNPSLSLRK